MNYSEILKVFKLDSISPKNIIGEKLNDLVVNVFTVRSI